MLVLPPAPAALVLAGLAFATLSCRSAAARLLIIVLGPPGGVGEEGRAPLELPDPGVLPGELGGGDDCEPRRQRFCQKYCEVVDIVEAKVEGNAQLQSVFAVQSLPASSRLQVS